MATSSTAVSAGQLERRVPAFFCLFFFPRDKTATPQARAAGKERCDSSSFVRGGNEPADF